MNEHLAHPALSSSMDRLVCTTPSCAALLEVDAEACDECGGTRFERLSGMPAYLCGWAGERPVVFRLEADRPAMIGRSSPPGLTPDVDLVRFPGSRVVHRQHARIVRRDGRWQVEQLGANPSVVAGHARIRLTQGETAEMQHGDTLEIARIHLTLVVRDLHPSM